MQDKKNSVRTNKKLNKGGRNLVFLGVFSIIIAALTTGVSLVVYHNSGDIYLDRSRPGFLPDEEEIEDEEEREQEYVFSKTGKITMADIEEYLKNLEMDIRAIDSYEKPFGSDIISDEHLGIPSE